MVYSEGNFLKTQIGLVRFLKSLPGEEPLYGLLGDVG